MKIPTDRNEATIRVEGRNVKLTNLQKIFWKRESITKGQLLQYYADVAKWLLPHIRNRAMVMKRYPNGASGEHFFMKRIPENHPEWIATCSIPHKAAGEVRFPVINDLPSLLWVINLGCIDLNPWYGRCDDFDRPDFLHFDLDPTPGTSFPHVLETALILRDTLRGIDAHAFAKTTGSRGIHICVPIERGPQQKSVWNVAHTIALHLAKVHPKLVTAEYRIAKRPRGRVLVDYNQNAWGRTLASVYSVRPKPRATVSAPVTWEEIEKGMTVEDFRIGNMPARLKKMGDLWKPLLGKKRFDLGVFVD